MKRCILLLLLLLVANPVYAQEVQRQFSGVIGSAGAGTWCYSNGTSTEPTWNLNVSRDDTTAFGAIFYPACSTGTGTKLAIKINAVDTATECKVALYTFTGWSQQTLLQSCTISSPTTGWNDCTISQSISSSTDYMVLYECNGSYTDVELNDNPSGVYNSIAYSSFPPSTLTPSEWYNYLGAVRVLIQREIKVQDVGPDPSRGHPELYRPKVNGGLSENGTQGGAMTTLFNIPKRHRAGQ